MCFSNLSSASSFLPWVPASGWVSGASARRQPFVSLFSLLALRSFSNKCISLANVFWGARTRTEVPQAPNTAAAPPHAELMDQLGIPPLVLILQSHFFSVLGAPQVSVHNPGSSAGEIPNRAPPRRARKEEEGSSPLQIGPVGWISEGTYLTRLAEKAANGQIFTPTRQNLNGFVEALTGFRHGYHPDGLNNTLISQGYKWLWPGERWAEGTF